MRFVLLALAPGFLCSCLKVSTMKGPDGADDWLYITCSNKERCLEEAARRCPTGYKIGDSGAEVSGSNGSTSSSSNVLVKCSSDEFHPGAATAPKRSTGRALGGFALATPIAEVIPQCENAGGTWTEEEGGGRCSSTASPGPIEGAVRIRTFKDRVYSLRMSIGVKDDGSRAWMAAFRQATGAIAMFAGRAQSEKTDVPEECKKDFVACLRSGAVSPLSRWSWPKQGFAEVHTTAPKAPEERPEIEVVLSLPARTDAE